MDTTMQPMEMTEALAQEGFTRARDYFRTADKEGADYTDKVLKVLGVYSRIRATRANEAAISVAVARMMGLSGADLAPVWEQLTGRAAALPDKRERSSAAKGAAK